LPAFVTFTEMYGTADTTVTEEAEWYSSKSVKRTSVICSPMVSRSLIVLVLSVQDGGDSENRRHKMVALGNDDTD